MMCRQCTQEGAKDNIAFDLHDCGLHTKMFKFHSFSQQHAHPDTQSPVFVKMEEAGLGRTVVVSFSSILAQSEGSRTGPMRFSPGRLWSRSEDEQVGPV